MQIADPLCQDGCLLLADKEKHQGAGKDPNDRRYQKTEGHGGQNGPLKSRADALLLTGTVVLRDEGGKGIAKVLHRHVGKRIDLYSCGEGRHDSGAEAVDQTLDHQDAEIHHGLLETGQHGKSCDLF